VFRKNPNISNRKLAEKVGCSEKSIRRSKAKLGLKTYKVQTTPDRNAEKNIEAKKRARSLKSNFFNKNNCCVMDDETYILSSFNQLPGQEFYTASGRGDVDKRFRTKMKSKFPKKYLVWQAICTCGMRSQTFVASGTVNTDIYIEECLKKRLLSFILKHKESPFFWPDLASCHYSKKALQWYNDNNITFVPREANPPNCPELRSIERYWTLVKRRLKETKKEVKTINQLESRWNHAAKTVSEDTIKKLMTGIPKKITEFCKNN
jgi:hypothetical protein